MIRALLFDRADFLQICVVKDPYEISEERGPTRHVNINLARTAHLARHGRRPRINASPVTENLNACFLELSTKSYQTLE